jgi:hypothetical protein
VYTVGTVARLYVAVGSGLMAEIGATGAWLSREHDAVRIAHAASFARERKFILMSRGMEGVF